MTTAIPPVVMLLADDSPRIHAEGAHLVFKGVAVVDHFGLIQMGGQVIHNRVGYLHPHPDVHLVVAGADTVEMDLLTQPVGAAAAGSGHHI